MRISSNTCSSDTFHDNSIGQKQHIMLLPNSIMTLSFDSLKCILIPQPAFSYRPMKTFSNLTVTINLWNVKEAKLSYSRFWWYIIPISFSFYIHIKPFEHAKTNHIVFYIYLSLYINNLNSFHNVWISYCFHSHF